MALSRSPSDMPHVPHMLSSSRQLLLQKCIVACTASKPGT
jgi:hypothetical protein